MLSQSALCTCIIVTCLYTFCDLELGIAGPVCCIFGWCLSNYNVIKCVDCIKGQTNRDVYQINRWNDFVVL